MSAADDNRELALQLCLGWPENESRTEHLVARILDAVDAKITAERLAWAKRRVPTVEETMDRAAGVMELLAPHDSNPAPVGKPQGPKQPFHYGPDWKWHGCDQGDCKWTACVIARQALTKPTPEAPTSPKVLGTARRCLYCQTGEVERCICAGLLYPQPPTLPASVVALIAAVRAWDFSNDHHPACGCQDCAIILALAAIDREQGGGA